MATTIEKWRCSFVKRFTMKKTLILLLVFTSACNTRWAKKVTQKEEDSLTFVFQKMIDTAKASDLIEYGVDDSLRNKFFRSLNVSKDTSILFLLNAKKGIIYTKYLKDSTYAAKLKNSASLRKNFDYTYDEFKKEGFYTHKRFGRFNILGRKTIYAYFNTSGDLFLVSQYYAHEWLFHTNIEVLVDGHKYQSEDIPTHSSSNESDNNGDYVWEIITYSGSNDITSAIASPLTKSVKIRFNGRQHYDDATLSSIDIKAFKETFELYNLLKRK
ncbi:MAG: hypothetical protein NTX03_02660 [Bacteroidetes bacterium]|nr:hypothetical protein [Bacteroidota bacterium]